VKPGLPRGEDGQAALEFVGLLPVMLVCALAALQLLLTGYAVQAEDGAVRTAAREAARGGDAAAAARAGVPGWLARGMEPVQVSGETVTVRVHVPVLIPGLDVGPVLTRSATFHRP